MNQIAQQLKERNIAEYLIYMWQEEDLIRANHCEPEELETNVIVRYPEDQRAAMREWYGNLITMMSEEGVREKGHLQINKNVILNLTELHNALSSSPKFPFYSAAYFKALPFIVELRTKNGKKEEPELETCFEALYGVLLLRLQKKPISEGTAKAIEAISSFLSMLANYYDKDRKGELKLDEYMRILVTGADGQLGNEMQVLAKENPQHTYYFTDVQELDICDKQAVWAYIAEKRIELIVNCAAYTAVDKAEDNPELAYKLNCEAAKELASAAQFNGAAMIQVSTDYVFDGTAHIPYTEDCDPCPDSVYGTTKLEGEYDVMNYCEKAVVIRTSWLYSTFGNNFVKTMIRLGKERDSLGVVFDQIGTPTYANDLAQAIYTIINKGIVRGIYHFSNEGVCSWYDFTVAIHRLAGITSCKVKPLHTAEYPAKANRPAYSVLDKTKIKTTFGIEIPHWEESLKRCIDTL